MMGRMLKDVIGNKTRTKISNAIFHWYCLFFMADYFLELAKAIHIRVHPVSNSYVNAKPAHCVILGYGGFLLGKSTRDLEDFFCMP